MTYEQHKQAAIRINDLAGQIHSEANASAIVSEIAAIFAKDLPPVWATGGIRERVARAEYEAVSNPAKLIPEQRIADVWNRYVSRIPTKNIPALQPFPQLAVTSNLASPVAIE
jgi:hypothetical protein